MASRAGPAPAWDSQRSCRGWIVVYYNETTICQNPFVLHLS